MRLVCLLTQVISLFIPNDAPKNRITNDDILKELEACFQKTIQDQSMKGRKMLYDSHFITFLHPDDYNIREQTLGFVVKEAINGFYAIIRKNKKYYGSQPFVPPTKSWYLQFSPTEVFLEEEIKWGDLKIISVFSTELATNGTAMGMVRVTFKPRLSTHYESGNINTDALPGMDFIGKGLFSIKFDETLGQITEEPRSADDGLAKLSYTLHNKECTYPMHEPEIIISRKREDGKYPPNTLAIDSNLLNEQHARIKCDVNNKRFFIAAFANTRVNEIALPLSQGDEVQWIALESKSHIMLGMLGIDFQNLLTQ